jgi:hypothetical protein
MAFNITTTGGAAIVVFDDLGSRTLTHPTTIDLQQEYTIEELFESDSIQNALVSGSISITHNGLSVSDLNDYRVRVSENVINNISNMDAISLNPTGGAGQSYDWNTVITAGVYRGNGTTTNGPSGFNGFESVLVYTPVGSDYIVHQALDGTGTVFAFRRSNNAGVTWSVWTSVPSSSSTKEHRHIYFAARNTIDTIIAATGTPTKVLGTSTQGFGTSGLTMSTNGRITNTSLSTLRVEVKAEISCDKEQAGGKDNFTFYIAQTGAVLIGSKSTTEGSNNDDNTASPSWIGDLAVGQYFEVYVSNIDNPNNLKVSDLSLIVKEL